MYLSIHPQNPQGRHIRKAVEVLNRGGVIIYPTDTVYGFGCSIYNSDAIERIYRLKQEEHSKTYSFICSDLSHISEFARVSNPSYRLMKQLIPGPYTFILPACRLKQLPRNLLSRRKTVGIRVPDNPICHMLIKELGHPILNASVLNNGGDIMSDPEIIREHFEDRVDLILGSEPSLLDFSTILDLTEEPPVVVREGAGDVTMILAA